MNDLEKKPRNEAAIVSIGMLFVEGKSRLFLVKSYLKNNFCNICLLKNSRFGCGARGPIHPSRISVARRSTA